jgi:hypothetical protein
MLKRSAPLLRGAGSSTVTTPVRRSAKRSMLDVVQWQPASASAPWFCATQAQRDATARVHRNALARWRADPRWAVAGQASHLVDTVHQHYRAGLETLLCQATSPSANHNQSAPLRVNLDAFRDLMKQLHEHHESEDLHIFPLVIAHYPEVKFVFDWLEEDHKHLAPLERNVLEAGDAASLREFSDFVIDHLNREELVMVPITLEAEEFHGHTGPWRPRPRR